MRILHISPYYRPSFRYGGPIASVHGLCKALVRLGHECCVYTTNADGSQKLEVPLGRAVAVEGVQVTYFDSPFFLRKIFYAYGMARAIDRSLEGFDLVHLHAPYVWPTWVGASQALKHKKPYVLTTRGMLVKNLISQKNSWAKTMWIHLIERRNLEKASLVHFTTASEEAEVRKFGFDLKKTIVLGHGIDEPSGNEAIEEKAREDIRPFLEGRPFLLYVGRVSWEKGLGRLIEAMAQVKRIPLVLVGDDNSGYSQKLRAIAQKCGVLDRIIFAGAYYGSVKLSLYRKANLFILPSFSENFGNVVLEAMIEGCPVIVTAGVGLAEFVTQRGGGFVVDGSPESLAGAVNRLLSDPGLYRRIKIAGPQAVRENFAWDKIAAKITKYYQEVFEEYKK